MHLSDKALLVHLGVSQWTARKLDKKASAQVAAAHGAKGNVGNYHKSLLPTCHELETVKTETSVIRKDFYHNTLPWGIEGTFILPSANYLPFMTEYRGKKAVWLDHVTAFLDVYEQRRSDAQHILSNLYKPADYPILADLKRKFRMDLSVMPVPTGGDFRVELADAEYEHIKSDIEQRVAECSQAAMKDVWQRLYDKVEWLADRLSDPKHTFHDNTYKDAQDTCKLLTRLNFTEDADLERMRQEVEQKLVRFHPETLRNDPDIRNSTKKDADAIMKKMAVFMGEGT